MMYSKFICSSIKCYIYRSSLGESVHGENDLPIYHHTHLIAILAGAVLANAAQEHTDKSQHVGGLVTLYIASKNILLINNF